MKRKLIISGIVLAALAVCSSAGAEVAPSESVQGPKKKTAVGQPHRQLDYFVGQWNTKLSHGDAPSDPGSAKFTMELGGRHLRQQFAGRMGKMKFDSTSYYSYDNRSKKYSHMWMETFYSAPILFVGDYDSASKVYTLKGELGVPYQSYSAEDEFKINEIIRIVDQNNFVVEWHDIVDGKSVPAMKIEYVRAK
ncbi:DUF1579 family protein [Lysobacter sp. CA196]|uniref:DUF1579 family protein n=1 Tax=Lysobacter sp. CA196 TaxID=3455606 RepID=UPI003F8D163F